MATLEQEWEILGELELEGEFELEGELEGEGEFEAHELEGEFELESEFELEGEGELEMEISPVRKIYADAMMEHLAHVAAECESEQEAAEQFLPLIGMAAKKLLPVVAKAVGPAVKRAIPRIAKAVTRLEPQLTRGVTRIVRGLYRNPETRRLIRAVPSIARRTISSIAGQVARGKPITAQSAIRTLARQTNRVLSHPHRRRHVLRRSWALDRRFHRQVGPQSIRPHKRGLIMPHRGGGHFPHPAPPHNGGGHAPHYAPPYPPYPPPYVPSYPHAGGGYPVPAPYAPPASCGCCGR